MPRVALTIVVVLAAAAAGCSREPAPVAGTASVQVQPDRNCVVMLHGKGRTGASPAESGGVTYLRPDGNAEAWGGREWRYFPDDRYQEVRAAVADAIAGAGCGRVIVQGFSNGAAAAAKLYCRGERLPGVIGYILDDPVPDGAVDRCTPLPDVRVRLYWSGALSTAVDGWSCASQDWTCEGGHTVGIERYARALSTGITPSIHTSHTEYASPPEQASWFDQGR